MSKKLKSLLCAVLAGTMLATSAGITAAADDIDDAEVLSEDVEVTEVAKASSADKYEGEEYYQRALSVCSALDIIRGYDDGSVQPESTVTRAEMTAIILRLIAIEPTATYQGIFDDVSDSHWASSVIQTGVEQKIIDGMGDGTFIPDGPVKYEQVLKMIVCAMNYGLDAEGLGGYPNGYVSVASKELELTKNIQGSMGIDMPRGEVIKSIFNALLAKYKYVSGFKNNDPSAPIYVTGRTLGEEKFDMQEATGVITATPSMSIAPGVRNKDGVVVIDDTEYSCTLKTDNLIATKVKYYYIKKNSERANIIAIATTENTQEYTFEDELVDSIDTVNGQIKVYSSKESSTTKKYKIAGASIVYNGSLLSYNNGVYDNMIKPEVGTVRIVDYDGDSNYDVLFADCYEQMVVTSVTSDKITGFVGGSEKTDIKTIDYDLDDSSYEISVKKSGSSVSPMNLRKNDVISVKVDDSGKKIEIIYTGESVRGTISSYNKQSSGEVTVMLDDGNEYKVDKNAQKTITGHGLSGTFYLDAFGRIGYATLGSTMSDSEKYGMIANVYNEEDGTPVIRIVSQTGSTIDAKISSSAKVWLPGDNALASSLANIKTILNDNSRYIQVSGMPLKLCKYGLNSSGELSKLYVAVSKSNAGTAEDALVAYTNSAGTNTLKNVSSVGGIVAGYSIRDGIPKFIVPDNDEDRKDGANYKTGTVTASTYKNYDGGYSHDYTVADFTDGGTNPNVLVEYAVSATSVGGVTAIENDADNETFMVSKITQSVDSKGDPIFKLTGYTNGSEVVYNTTTTTGVYDLDPSFPNGTSEYASKATLFEATSDSMSAFTNNVHIGDVFLVGANGSSVHTLIRLATVDRVVQSYLNNSAYTTGQWMQHISPASSRENFFSGFVGDVNIADTAIINITDRSSSNIGAVPYSISKRLSLVTVTLDESNNITDVTVDKNGGIKPDELHKYDPENDNISDYVICKSFKGNMGSCFVIRIEK